MNPSAPVTRVVRPSYTSANSPRSFSSAYSVHVESCLFELGSAMEFESTQPSLPHRGSAVRSGIATGMATLAVSGSAALAGAYLAHKFGRNAETDGFLAAYGVYLVLVL